MMLRTFLILLPAVARVAAGQQASAPRARATEALLACEWSAPAPVPGVSPGYTIRWPSLAVHGTSAYLAANLFPVDGKARLPDPPLVLMRLDGEAMSRPPGEHLFAHPQGVFDSSGRYHLVWGDATARWSSAESWPIVATSLWHAVWANSRWSTPTRILGSAGINWGPNEGQLIADLRGGIQLVVPSRDSTGRQVVVHLRWQPGQWVTQQIAGSAAYTTMTSWHRDTALIVYAGGHAGVDGAPNTLNVVRSFDGGVTWQRAVRFGDQPAAYARAPVLRSQPGAVTLAWLDMRSDTIGRETLVIARSADGGVSWTTLLRDTLGTSVVLSHSIQTTPAGRLAMILSRYDGRLRLTEIHGDGSALSTRPLFPSYPIAAMATIVQRPAGLAILFTGSDVPDGGARLLYSTRSDCARGRP